MLIFSRAPLFLWAEVIATACYTQNRSIIYRRFNKTPYELINGRKPNISFLHVFRALCYLKNGREDIGKLGTKGDIGFFIGYSANSCTYRVYNRRTKKIMETINVTFDELLAMAFEQRSSKPGLQSMTSGQINLGLDLTYAPSTITTQQPTKGLEVKQKEDGIFISQDKYVTEILKKFSFSDVKTASTPMETHNPLLKDVDGKDIDEYMYRSMIGSLMYLTSSRPDIMFVVCVCAKFHVNPKVSHLHAVKRIFRYLKGQPKLGLWYPKDSPFDLVAYTDSDYAGASLDKKSTTGGCQFLGCRLISWQCKKQTMVTNSITDVEYVAASIAFLTKSAESKGFEQILDFLNASSIKRDLQLEVAEGIDCLPNAAIFEQLTLMGAKTTAWNEFSSTMASIIICLAINQKFNFSKYIVDSIVKNVDNVNKILMYLRFVQMFVIQQASDMSNHKRIYVTPSHTKKVFGNIKRKGKGFSGRVTSLIPTMMVQAQQEQGEGSANPTDPQHTPTIAQPSSSQPQKKHKPRKPKKKEMFLMIKEVFAGQDMAE
ncbi:uncharacterized mitochondrial protein-like protein [Tanacetum coccineum]